MFGVQDAEAQGCNYPANQQAWVFIHALVWDLVFDMDHVQMGDWIDDIFLLRLVDGDCA